MTAFLVETEMRVPAPGERYVAHLEGGPLTVFTQPEGDWCDGYVAARPVRLPRACIIKIVAADAVTREGRGGESSVVSAVDSLCTSAATPTP